MSKRPTPTDLFGRETASDVNRDTSAPNTADRGAGAPAYRTARDAVRQDAVRYGSSDPDSGWNERRMLLTPRSRTEYLVIGSDLYSSLDALASAVRGGPVKAARVATPEPSAIDLIVQARPKIWQPNVRAVTRISTS